MSRRTLAVAFPTGACLLTALTLVLPSAHAARGDRLPDLRAAQLHTLNIESDSGVRKLKFPATVYNTGRGAFEMVARRASTDGQWSMRQRIQRRGSTWRSVSTSANVYYGGDGHDHWHVRDLNKYTLRRLSINGRPFGPVRVGEKHGFCFHDNARFRDWPGRVAGSPVEPFYDLHATPAACALSQPYATRMIQGLSRGWGDTYWTDLPDQFIDITGLPNGNYRLRFKVDQANQFLETRERNNATYADLRIIDNQVTVLSRGGGV